MFWGCRVDGSPRSALGVRCGSQRAPPEGAGGPISLSPRRHRKPRPRASLALSCCSPRGCPVAGAAWRVASAQLPPRVARARATTPAPRGRGVGAGCQCPTCTAPTAITHTQNRRMPRGTSGKATIKENCSQKTPQNQDPQGRRAREPQASAGLCLVSSRAVLGGSGLSPGGVSVTRAIPPNA